MPTFMRYCRPRTMHVAMIVTISAGPHCQSLTWSSSDAGSSTMCSISIWECFSRNELFLPHLLTPELRPIAIAFQADLKANQINLYCTKSSAKDAAIITSTPLLIISYGDPRRYNGIHTAREASNEGKDG